MAENPHPLRWTWLERRRKLAQAMRTENVKITGSRWNRPCPLAFVCQVPVDCVCNRKPIVARRSRGCNRVACSFLKWCRAIPEMAEHPPLWRLQWAFAMVRCPQTWVDTRWSLR